MESVYFNGTIHTLDPAKPLVEALSAADGRVVETGSSGEILARRAPRERTVDLCGKAVIPALTDAHAHLLAYAEESTWLDLAGASSLAGILEMVSSRLGSSEGGRWVLGRGWDQNRWPGAHYPEKAAIDRIAPENPVYLLRVCGHAAVVNSAALRLAGITRDTVDPRGGRILRDADGEPSGVLLDEAKGMVARSIAAPTNEEKKRLLVAAARRCLAAGLTGVHEMGMSAEDVALCEELYSAGLMPLRITAYLSADDPGNARFLESGPYAARCGERFRIIGVKLYADGSLGARSAALLADYSDDPGNRGILMKDSSALRREIVAWREKGFQPAVHAIGDRAVREVLDAYERLDAECPRSDARNRIEHVQVVSQRDIPRFATLGVIPSMQFIHCASDMPWAEARLGKRRMGGAYAWRSLISAGARICGGSDFPVEPVNPFLGIHAAVTRRDTGMGPRGGPERARRLTVDEAVRAFTAAAAYAGHADAASGSLSPGKLADFLVLSDDLFLMEPLEIPTVEVLATVLGGEMVYGSLAL